MVRRIETTGTSQKELGNLHRYTLSLFSMPLTRHRRLTAQNASQPIHRLGPELLSEIFLQARPNVFTELEGETNAWAKLIRYLVDITSVSCYFPQIALDFGGVFLSNLREKALPKCASCHGGFFGACPETQTTSLLRLPYSQSTA